MNKIRKAVITAAGRGTRMYPASATLQKELFPIVDVDGYVKPVLQIIVEEALRSGIEEVCVVANPINKEPIERHFKGLGREQLEGQFKGKDWAIPLSEALEDAHRRLTFVTQTEQEGFGHAVYQAKSWVGDDPFILLVGDHVYISETEERCVAQVMRLAQSTDSDAFSSLMTFGETQVPRYGVAALEKSPESDQVYKITALVEKPTVEYANRALRTSWLPEGMFYGFFGIHAMPALLFECLEELIVTDTRVKGEIQLTSALELLLSRCRYVSGEVLGKPHDMGIPEGLIETQTALALRSPYRQQVTKQIS